MGYRSGKLSFSDTRGEGKTAEHDILNVEQYISKAEKQSGIRAAFVYTDDYDFITLLNHKYPDWKIYTLTSEDEHGYYHQKFLKLSPAEKRNNLLKMFASMEYLKNAELTFCTFSSNPGMFLGMCMGDKAIGVDFDYPCVLDKQRQDCFVHPRRRACSLHPWRNHLFRCWL